MTEVAAKSCAICSASLAGRHPSTVVCSDACRKARQREHRNRWGKRNQARLSAANRVYRERNRDRYSEYGYKRRYGLAFNDVSAMWESQGRCCAICKQPVRLRGPKGRNKVVVDHCHETGRVRGLLCTPCNLMIGYAQDSEELLRSAIQYLEG